LLCKGILAAKTAYAPTGSDLDLLACSAAISTPQFLDSDVLIAAIGHGHQAMSGSACILASERTSITRARCAAADVDTPTSNGNDRVPLAEKQCRDAPFRPARRPDAGRCYAGYANVGHTPLLLAKLSRSKGSRGRPHGI